LEIKVSENRQSTDNDFLPTSLIISRFTQNKLNKNKNNIKINSTRLKLVNENYLHRTCVRQRQQMYG